MKILKVANLNKKDILLKEAKNKFNSHEKITRLYVFILIFIILSWDHYLVKTRKKRKKKNHKSLNQKLKSKFITWM